MQIRELGNYNKDIFFITLSHNIHFREKKPQLPLKYKIIHSVKKTQYPLPWKYNILIIPLIDENRQAVETGVLGEIEIEDATLWNIGHTGW